MSEIAKPTSADAPTGQFDPRLAGTIDHVPGSTPSNLRPERRLPEPGEQFGGYQIVRMLGKGGMGAVYEAEEIETGRRVALKVLKHSLDSPEARKRFLREGRLAASVNHPNSVYVFGTEEIEGTPAIAMELVAGGTLQELVKRDGTLPIGKAVDTILQIIAGLEAAQKAGVLHRDIKPANCFIDADGTVKIGDFGLSISTEPRGDADVTQSGGFLGTPAFSSPEQLRGDELNVRSDIYSVGVTLYYLLTGRTPFEADNMVKLLATVLEQSAPSPRNWRPEIPRTLAAVLLRCVAKQPADRYCDYRQLRKALLPFASTPPSAATLVVRTLAFLIDATILGMLVRSAWQLGYHFPAQEPLLTSSTGIVTARTVIGICYFAILEGIWGTSPGKALCGIKVIRLNRAPPGIPRAAARAVIIVLIWNLDAFVSAIAEPRFATLSTILMNYLSLLVLAWLFNKAQRSNGYTARHDQLTGTRVVSRAIYHARPEVSHAGALTAVADAKPQIGPYHVLETLAQVGGQQWLLGYDTRLLRRVWIYKLPAGAPPVEVRLRNVGRVGRFRWLAGRRSLTENWDVYEASSGQPLVSLLIRRQPWSVVRFWLLDLAEESRAAAKDETSPSRLDLDRVWITAEGRAKLLDVPAPGIAPRPDNSGQFAPPAGDFGMMRTFLNQVAMAALEGRMVTAPDAKLHVPAAPVPVRGRNFLLSLKTLADPESGIQALREVVRQPSEVSWFRRLVPVLVCSIPSLTALAMGLLMMLMFDQYQRKHPDLQPLLMHSLALSDLKSKAANRLVAMSLPGTPEEIEALERYIAFRFSKTIGDEDEMSTLYAEMIPDELLRLLHEAVRIHPDVTEAEFRQAEKLIAPLEQEIGKPAPFGPIERFCLLIHVAELSAAWLLVMSSLSLVAALVSRGGFLLWALGLAIVRSDGAPASRFRVLARSLIAWSPFLLFFIVWVNVLWPTFILLDANSMFDFLQSQQGTLLVVAGGTGAACYLAIAIWSSVMPGRGIPDRLAGTWLVPR